MNKLISLFLLPVFIMGAELCEPRYWETVSVDEVSLEAYQDVYYDRRDDMSKTVFSDWIQTKEGQKHTLCVMDREDTNARLALCLNPVTQVPYCWFNETSFLKMALDHSNNFRVVEKLWQEGFTAGLEDVISGGFLDVDPDLEFEKRYASLEMAVPQDVNPDWAIDDLTLDYGLDDDEEEEEEEEEERVTVEEVVEDLPVNLDRIKKGLYGNISVGKVESKTLGLGVKNDDARTWSNPFQGSDGGSMSAAVGYKRGIVSVEYEHSVRHLDSNSFGEESIGTVGLRTNFVNAHLDLLDGRIPLVQPFVGVGGGHISHGYDYQAQKRAGEFIHRADQAFTNSGWTYQYVGGLNVPISDNAEVSIKARYLQVPDVRNMGEWDILREGAIDKEEMFRNPVSYEHKMEGYGLLDAMVGFTVFWR